ncbi:hypothetical protein [Paenibacillus sp. MBLB4367]|uniref:hypothetical protein n=1 Tax=Paenibacillus sp. MBLB4367 TaxID=3384767 RepID=UPI0039080857
MKASASVLRSKWKKWEQSVTKLISDKTDKTEDFAVELEPKMYEQCVRMAGQHRVSVDAIVNHALEQYIAGKPTDYYGRATLEQRDRNPLFQLDALISRKNNMNDGEYIHESNA